MAQGLFITLEGGEGVGKSTQARMLGDALTTMGREVVLTREPGGSPGAEAIRQLVVHGAAGKWDGITETLLHTAARRDHVINTISPAMRAGKIVISDRFLDSMIAYQGYGHGVDRDTINTISHAAIGDFKPNLTLILDLPVGEGLERAKVRGGTENRYESMGQSFHGWLRQGFLAIAKAEPERCKVIDATRGIDAIHADILAEVTAFLKTV